MKPSNEWDESYILSLPVQEYDNIEFKAPQWLDINTPEKKDKLDISLAKELCALANTGGGQLVIGVKDPQQTKGDVLEIVNGGTPKVIGNNKDTAEWLRAKVPSLLDFELTGFDVHAIVRGGNESKIDTDRALFVIDVPDSESAPHQSAKDRKYYMRVGGNSVPVGHRHVLDMMGRRHHPEIVLDFKIEQSSEKVSSRSFDVSGGLVTSQRDVNSVKLHIAARNKGRVYAKYVIARIMVPKAIVHEWESPHGEVEFNGISYLVFEEDNTKRDVVGGRSDGLGNNFPIYGPSWYAPILPGREMTWSILLREDFKPLRVRNQSIDWTTYADNGPATTDRVRINEIEFTTTDV